MARFDDTEEKQNQEVEANVDDEAPAAKKVVNLNVILSYFFVIDESWNSKRTQSCGTGRERTERNELLLDSEREEQESK